MLYLGNDVVKLKNVFTIKWGWSGHNDGFFMLRVGMENDGNQLAKWTEFASAPKQLGNFSGMGW